MDITTLIPQLTVDAPTEIFRKVVSFNSKITDTEKMARVRLGLVSGFVLEGLPLKMDRKGHALFLGNNNSISYVQTASIVGIELLNPSLMVSTLTDGSYFEIPVSKVPTNLELKRSAKSVSDKLKTNYDISMELASLVEQQQSDAGKYQLQRFLEVLLEVIEIIASDNLGEVAVKSLDAIALNEAAGLLQVQKKDGTLQIGIDLQRELTSNLKEQLQERIEAQL